VSEISTDICVIGAGSGGLSVAAGAVQMGARVVLIERGRMGGDCLNTGCVPSKALIHAGRMADRIRRAADFGIHAPEPRIDFAGVRRHVQNTIEAIAPMDSVARFEALGCTVLQDEARFLDPDRVAAGGRTVRAKRFVLATGSRPVVPPIPGLDGLPFLTNETIFDLADLPAQLLVIGGGPIGMELAQAFRHLGSRVTVIEAARALAKDDPELVEVATRRLAADGVALRQDTRVLAAGPGLALTLSGPDGESRIEGSHLLVAVGRAPDLAALNLEAAGIAASAKGIAVDARMRSTNRRVFAIGDATGDRQFTHWAGHQAGIVLRNALLRWPAKLDPRLCPRVTYTSPELAQVGMTEAEARADGHDPRVLRWSFAENDRARTEGDVEGLVKVVADKRGRILGCGIVGAEAGELIQLWQLAIGQGLKLGAIAGMIAPYPTRGEASKRAAGAFFAPLVFGARTRWLVRLLLGLAR
jgi:pyruvate/2-oxoglutarate dehydrogenase complex dihydrolipoamide dehydrogenase (E3) component